MKRRTVAQLVLGGLAYEILLKLCLYFFPSMLILPGVKPFITIMKPIVGLIFVSYGISLYRELRDTRLVRRTLQILIVIIALNIIGRLPFVREAVDFTASRLVDHSLGFSVSILIILFFFFLLRSTAENHRALRAAIVACCIMFTVNAVLGLIQLGLFSYFLLSDVAIESTPVFLGFMVLLFIITRIVTLNFVWQYEKVRLEFI